MNTYSIHHKGIILEDIPLDSLTAQLQRQGLFVNLPHEVEADAAPEYTEEDLAKDIENLNTV